MKHTMKTTAAPDCQAQRQEARIDFDPTNFEGMCRIMDEYGGSKLPFWGTTENGEDVWFSVFHDRITGIPLLRFNACQNAVEVV